MARYRSERHWGRAVPNEGDGAIVSRDGLESERGDESESDPARAGASE